MTAVAPHLSTQYLEQRLAQQRDERQRIALIDELTDHYVYTHVQKAQQLLLEQQRLLENREHEFPDVKLNYHLKTAIVENHLYNYYLAEIHFLRAIGILDERGATTQQVDTFIDYAGTCMNLNKMESALSFLQKADKKLQLFPDELIQARLLCRQGYLNLHYGNYSKALELLLESDKRLNQNVEQLDIKDYYFLTLVHSGLGKIYELNDEQELSVRAYLRVVNMCETMDMRSRLSWHYLSVGSGYMSMEDEESAAIYFRKAINVTDDVSLQARASAYANLGNCYFEQKLYDDALELYERAEALYKEQSPRDFFNFSILDSWKAQLYAELGQRSKALKHFQSAYAYAELVEDYRQLAEVCKGIATFYADLHDYKSAYQYLAEYDKMDALYSDQVQKRQRLEMQVKYEAEKKQREAELLQFRATQLQMKALRAQMNPHFLFNALNSIQNYITSNEVTFAAKYLSKFAKLMRRSLEYSEQEIISLEEEVEFLGNYMDINAKLRFGDRLSYSIHVDEDIEEDIIGVPTMIIQPYVENSIEHGLRPKENGLLQVSFKICEEDEDIILCIIEDNGVGRKRATELQQASVKHKEHKSMGTDITENRLKLLHPTREDEDEEDFVNIIDLVAEDGVTPLGTKVVVRIPIMEIQ